VVATQAPAPPAPGPGWFDLVSVGGLVDAYVSVPLRSDDGSVRDPSLLRTFDATNGSFALAYAEVDLAMAPEPVGFRLDLGFGPVADLTNQQVIDVGGAAVVVANETYKHLQQAFVSFQVPGVDALVVDFGRFVTTAGAEVIEAKDNWLYSRSLLFGFATPFSHTGLRATYAATSELTLQASLVNGWDVVDDNNSAKTFGVSGAYSHGDTTLVLTYYGGKEVSAFRSLVDLDITQRVEPAFTVDLNVDWGKDGDATWYGVSAMGRYEVSPRLRLSLRAEYLGDPDGARTGVPDLDVTEVTANVSTPLGQHVELRVEGRVDVASHDVFGTPRSDTQPTAQLAALAWF
jgi:hypothetical protein